MDRNLRALTSRLTYILCKLPRAPKEAAAARIPRGSSFPRLQRSHLSACCTRPFQLGTPLALNAPDRKPTAVKAWQSEWLEIAHPVAFCLAPSVAVSQPTAGGSGMGLPMSLAHRLFTSPSLTVVVSSFVQHAPSMSLFLSIALCPSSSDDHSSSLSDRREVNPLASQLEVAVVQRAHALTALSQAAGRAGRHGIDNSGESFLLAKPADAGAVATLMQAKMPMITSCLTPERRGMTRALLEAVASGVVSTVYDIQRYICCTFYAAQSEYNAVHKATKDALGFLEEHDFVQWNSSKAVFTATKLGVATFSSALSPDEGLVVKDEIDRARDSFNLNNELHLVYHLTPVFHGIEPEWKSFYWLWSKLSKNMADVARTLEIEERYLFTASTKPPARQSRDRKAMRHRRFFVALMLYDLIHEYTLYDVAQKYGVSRGELQKLQVLGACEVRYLLVNCHRAVVFFFL